MKILYIITKLRSGGRERRIVELMSHIIHYKDINVKLILFSKDIFYDYIINDKIEIFFINNNNKKNPFLKILKIIKICKRYKPDIVHTFGVVSSIYLFPARFLYKFKFINNSITDVPNSFLVFWKKLILFKLSKHFSDLIISNTKLGLKAYKAKGIVINNGFNFNRIARLVPQDIIKEKFNIKNKYIVGMVASFNKFKNYDTFFNVAVDLLEKRDDITFLCVGSDYNHYKYDKYIERYPNNIMVLDSQKEIEDIMNIFTIGILLSYTEGMPNSVIEMMALAKPVIASDVGAVSEIIIDKKNGYLVKNNEVNKIVGLILFLIDNQRWAEKIGSNAFDTIKGKFNIRKMINSYYKVYNKVAN